MAYRTHGNGSDGRVTRATSNGIAHNCAMIQT
jgi:hypothetical protein